MFMYHTQFILYVTTLALTPALGRTVLYHATLDDLYFFFGLSLRIDKVITSNCALYCGAK